MNELRLWLQVILITSLLMVIVCSIILIAVVGVSSVAESCYCNTVNANGTVRAQYHFWTGCVVETESGALIKYDTYATNENGYVLKLK